MILNEKLLEYTTRYFVNVNIDKEVKHLLDMNKKQKKNTQNKLCYPMTHTRKYLYKHSDYHLEIISLSEEN